MKTWSPKSWLAATALLLLHLAIIFAPNLAPYDYAEQHRDLPYAPPQSIHFFDTAGRFYIRPFVYPFELSANEDGSYREDKSNIYPLRFFVASSSGHGWHLFGVAAPGTVFFMGTDQFGRDQFSRLLYGGRISLAAGLLATLLTLALGALLGALAGFYGRWADRIIMRGAELFLALPWLYLLLAVRAFLPLRLAPTAAFLLLVTLIGLVGWARPARLVRSVVLSARERNYVLAGRSFGASNLYLLRRHILPQASSVILTQAALLVPQYVLAEVTLSFFGLGVAEPVPSWGNMLAALQQYNVLMSYWWMFLPALILIPVFLGYFALANAFEKRLEFIPT